MIATKLPAIECPNVCWGSLKLKSKLNRPGHSISTARIPSDGVVQGNSIVTKHLHRETRLICETETLKNDESQRIVSG